MNINTWQQLSALKKDLYGSLNFLITDPFVEREVIASDLLSSIKRLNGIEEVYQRFLQKSEIHLVLIGQKTEKGIPLSENDLQKKEKINFGHLEDISSIKAGLLNVVYVLLEDVVVEREAVAVDLLLQVNKLNDVEQGCIKILQESEFARIDQLCLELELKREKKKAFAS